MKFTLSWLKDHLETTASTSEISQTLTDIGLEVEDVTEKADQLKGFKTAVILEVNKHPNADKLNLCKVTNGTVEKTVVCGAPNVRPGLKTVFVDEGTCLPTTGQPLKKGMIRGVESSGMLCSENDLGISDEHDGIIELPAATEIGRDYAEVAGFNDPIFDISLTPNRGDCAGVYGIARDLAAKGIGTLKTIQNQTLTGSFTSPIAVKIAPACEGDLGCHQFAAIYVKNVKNGESPKALQDKLIAIGQKPISALVDITNFSTHDTARPLHVFDADLIKGNLVIRLAQAGETFQALDDKTYTMKGGELVISDDNGIQSLAGVIGGKATGCSFETKNVLIECALFAPHIVAKNGRTHTIDSDARYRFERGLDAQYQVPGLIAAAHLVQKLCGGEASTVLLARNMPSPAPKIITYDPQHFTQLIGFEVDVAQQMSILKRLGFDNVPRGTLYEITVPSWRNDVSEKVDLIEEIGRMVGFDKLPEVAFTQDGFSFKPALTADQNRSSQFRRVLAGRGLSEVVTYSFMSSKIASLFGEITDSMKLLNPISADLDVMRPSLAGNLLQAAQRNADRGFKNFGLFELGPVFDVGAANHQRRVVAGIRFGQAIPKNWLEAHRQVDAYDAKSDLFALIESAGLDPQNLLIKEQNGRSYYHPGRSASIALGNKILGYFGEIHPYTLKKLGITDKVVLFELEIDQLPPVKDQSKKGTAKAALELNPLQLIQRDFAIVLDRHVPADQVIRSVMKVDKAVIKQAEIFDVYEGDKVEADKKSLAFSVLMQPMEKSFTDVEIEALRAKILEQVEKDTGGKLRA